MDDKLKNIGLEKDPKFIQANIPVREIAFKFGKSKHTYAVREVNIKLIPIPNNI